MNMAPKWIPPLDLYASNTVGQGPVIKLDGKMLCPLKAEPAISLSTTRRIAAGSEFESVYHVGFVPDST